MTDPTLEEMIEDYNRHMKWYVQTWNHLVDEWHRIQCLQGSANE